MSAVAAPQRAKLVAALDRAARAVRGVGDRDSGVSRALALLTSVHQAELLRAHPELTRLEARDRDGAPGYRLLMRGGRGPEVEVCWIAAEIVEARLAPHEIADMLGRET